MRALAAFLPALALLASVPAAADPSIEPLSWLQRAAASARQGNYAGTIMHVQGERTSTSRMTHLVVAGIEAGFFPNRPERPGWRFYVGCHYCEPDGLGTAERWAEWERKHHDPRLAPWFGVDEATP